MTFFDPHFDHFWAKNGPKNGSKNGQKVTSLEWHKVILYHFLLQLFFLTFFSVVRQDWRQNPKKTGKNPVFSVFFGQISKNVKNDTKNQKCHPLKNDLFFVTSYAKNAYTPVSKISTRSAKMGHVHFWPFWLKMAKIVKTSKTTKKGQKIKRSIRRSTFFAKTPYTPVWPKKNRSPKKHQNVKNAIFAIFAFSTLFSQKTWNFKRLSLQSPKSSCLQKPCFSKITENTVFDLHTLKNAKKRHFCHFWLLGAVRAV